MSRGSVPRITLAQIEFGLSVQALDEWFMPKVHDTLSSGGSWKGTCCYNLTP